MYKNVEDTKSEGTFYRESRESVFKMQYTREAMRRTFQGEDLDKVKQEYMRYVRAASERLHRLCEDGDYDGHALEEMYGRAVAAACGTEVLQWIQEEKEKEAGHE